MTPYFVLLGIWLAGSIQFSSKKDTTQERIFYIAALLFTIVMVGFRYRVGGDWVTYQDMYANISLQTPLQAVRSTDPAYAFLNWASAQVDAGVYVPNLACAVVLMLGLSSLVRQQPNPWLAMMVAVPYLVIVVGMGYTRQAAAIGVICWAISTTDDDRVWETVAKVAFAALFHKTAILFLPILLAPIARRNFLFGIVGSVAFVAFAFMTLRGSSDRLVENYVNSDYQSGGAAVRISMNVAAAGVFVAFRNRFPISSGLRLIWMILSGLAIVSIFGLVVSSSSVGVDRLALFLIPLQVFVYGNLPNIPSIGRRTNVMLIFLVIVYSVAVEYVYFAHGTFSYTWVPYRSALIPNDHANGD